MFDLEMFLVVSVDVQRQWRQAQSVLCISRACWKHVQSCQKREITLLNACFEELNSDDKFFSIRLREHELYFDVATAMREYLRSVYCKTELKHWNNVLKKIKLFAEFQKKTQVVFDIYGELWVIPVGDVVVATGNSFAHDWIFECDPITKVGTLRLRGGENGMIGMLITKLKPKSYRKIMIDFYSDQKVEMRIHGMYTNQTISTETIKTVLTLAGSFNCNWIED